MGIKATQIRSILELTQSGPTCPAPLEAEDIQWLKAFMSNLSMRHKLPSIFLSSGFVRRKFTSKEVGGILDLPLEIVRSSDGKVSPPRWITEVRVPFKIRTEILQRLAFWSRTGYVVTDPSPECAMVHEQPSAGKRVAEAPPSEGPIPTPNKRQAVGKGDSTHAPKKLEVEVIEDVGIPTVKATKLDDAVIPVFMWDVRVREGMTWLGPEASVFDRAIVVLCRWLHQLWQQRVVSSFWDWWKVKFCIPGLQLTEEGVNAFKVGQIALAHPSMSSWWDWDKGSSPFFWRFPDE
ncbi:hypothetical protein ACA910_018885 [Epithemia clementina (nom. ined.)]